MKRMLMLMLVIGLVALAPTVSQAQNLLTNGNLNSQGFGNWFEIPTGWNIETNPDSTSEFPPPSGFPPRYPMYPAEYADQNDPDASGTWGVVLNSTEGNFPGYEFEGYDAVDGDLWQDIPGTAGVKYQMRGFAYFEGGFAGGVENIDPDSPTTHAGLPSVTDVFFALEFLGAGDVVLPGSLAIELHDDASQENTRSEEFSRRNWYQHVLTAVAPAGTLNVRVRASLVDGEFNIDMPHQAAWVDNFSLTAVPEPASALIGLIGLALVGLVRRRR